MIFFEVEDRVADQLAGAVVGGVAAALDVEQVDAGLFEGFGAEQQVGAVGMAAHGDDRLVLH